MRARLRFGMTALTVIAALAGWLPVNHAAEADKPSAPFELRDGDRVVFVGNTLIEREQKSGWWETMLTARYPDRNVTFRNLGWDGDTVWAESRGIFDPPEVGYRRLIEQITSLKPTVIFLGYGGNEAFAGEQGLPRFLEQYEKLLDDLTAASADGVRFVILSPIPHADLGPPLPDPAPHNARLTLYSDALRDLSRQRGVVFVDLFSELTGPDGSLFPAHLTHNGIHLTDSGYWSTALLIQRLLFEQTEDWFVELTSDGHVEAAEGVRITNVRTENGRLRFTAIDHRLPLVCPDNLPGFDRMLRITELPAGRYTLQIDATAVVTAPAGTGAREAGITPCDSWLAGLQVEPSPDHDQAEQLRQAIIAKNELYFHHWRPQNVTYLFGFRKHEQGQNAKEVAEFEKLVAKKEAEIAKLRVPVTRRYELVREDEENQ